MLSSEIFMTFLYFDMISSPIVSSILAFRNLKASSWSSKPHPKYLFGCPFVILYKFSHLDKKYHFVFQKKSMKIKFIALLLFLSKLMHEVIWPQLHRRSLCARPSIAFENANKKKKKLNFDSHGGKACINESWIIKKSHFSVVMKFIA